MVDDVTGQRHVAELAEGWYLHAQVIEECLKGDLSGQFVWLLVQLTPNRGEEMPLFPCETAEAE